MKQEVKDESRMNVCCSQIGNLEMVKMYKSRGLRKDELCRCANVVNEGDIMRLLC